MGVWAIMRVKDEVDVIEATVTRLAGQVDQLLVADNGSRDGTRQILDQLPVQVLDDPDVAYYQADAMTALAHRAREHGATWVLPVDADEVWLARTGGRIADVLAELDPGVLIAEAQLFDHVATGEDPADETDPVRRLGWRRPDAAPLRKVAVRAHPGLRIHQGNHSAAFDGIAHPPTVTNALEVRHFPYRSVAQFVSKVRNGAAAYAATDLPEEVGSHWRSYGRVLAEHGEAGIEEIFRTWFWRARPGEPLAIGTEQQPPLIFDPCP